MPSLSSMRQMPSASLNSVISGLSVEGMPIMPKVFEPKALRGRDADHAEVFEPNLAGTEGQHHRLRFTASASDQRWSGWPKLTTEPLTMR